MVFWLISVTFAFFQIGINALKLEPKIKIACLQLAGPQDGVQHHLKQANMKMRGPQNWMILKPGKKQINNPKWPWPHLCPVPLPADEVWLCPAWCCLQGHQFCLVPSDSHEHLELLWLLLSPREVWSAPQKCCKEHKSKGYLVIIAGAVWPFHCFHHRAGFVPLLSSFYAPAYFWILECGPNFPEHPRGTHQPLDPDNSVEEDAQFQNPNCKSKECSSSTFHLLRVKPQKGINSA